MKSKEYKEFLSIEITRKRLTFQTTITGRKYALCYGIDARWRKKLKDDRYEVILDAIDKLGQYEDIEEELGIDLITLFKALKDGIYCKIGNKIEHILAPHLSWYCQQIYICNINDYGKTWALTKEELENEKDN